MLQESGVKRSGDSELPLSLDPFLGTGDIKKMTREMSGIANEETELQWGIPEICLSLSKAHAFLCLLPFPVKIQLEIPIIFKNRKSWIKSML